MQNYSGIENKDILAVTITHGYDIGIAQAWRSWSFKYSPSEWQDILILQGILPIDSGARPHSHDTSSGD